MAVDQSDWVNFPLEDLPEKYWPKPSGKTTEELLNEVGATIINAPMSSPEFEKELMNEIEKGDSE